MTFSLSRCFHKMVNDHTPKPTLPFIILSGFIWFNSNIKVDSKPVDFSFFQTNLNFIDQLFNNNGELGLGRIQTWNFILKILIKYTDYKLLMLCEKQGKNIVLKDKVNANLVIFNHFIARKSKSQICILKKLTSKELFRSCWRKYC